MPARRSEDPANETVRANINTLINNYRITDPDTLARHARWQALSGKPPELLRLHELGAEVGITESMLYKKLQGQHPFTIGEVKAIARFFGVTVDVITTEKKTRKGATHARS